MANNKGNNKMNTFQKYNKETITKLIKTAHKVYAWTMTSVHDGRYIRVYKNDLLEELEINIDYFDHVKFTLNEEDNLYIN